MCEVRFYNESNREYFHHMYEASEIPDRKQRKKRQRKKRRSACGKCEFCMKEDCGKCKNCMDMTKFGGQGKKRQRCEQRKCRLFR